MGQRSISEVMAEGQKLTLEQIELKRKEMAGTLTPEETTRLVKLDGYLLGLVGEAQALGVGIGVGVGMSNDEDSDEDLGLDEDEDLGFDEDEDEADERGYYNYG